MIRRALRFVRRLLHGPPRYASETSKVRHLVLPYCRGHGCDIGFGGDRIVAEDCVGIDLPRPYARTGDDRVDIACDVAREPIPLPDATFDYVYSSHLIEDIPDTQAVLREFTRILRPGGNLVLVFPDQPTYEEHCRRTGQPLNALHVHADMGLAYMKRQFDLLREREFTVLFESDRDIDYNVVIVARVESRSG